MVQRKTLQEEIAELGGEIAALRAERAAQRTEAAAKAVEPTAVAEPKPEPADTPLFGKSGELERALVELVEATESEIAEHPAIVAGVAFLAGVAVGRLSKG
jgi:hypothetical protein